MLKKKTVRSLAVKFPHGYSEITVNNHITELHVIHCKKQNKPQSTFYSQNQLNILYTVYILSFNTVMYCDVTLSVWKLC